MALTSTEGPCLARKMIGFVAQSAGLDKALTDREHPQMFAGLAHLGKKAAQRNVDAVIQILILGEFIERLALAQSGRECFEDATL
jgi:ABC-2 type transport system ATP-binding protein